MLVTLLVLGGLLAVAVLVVVGVAVVRGMDSRPLGEVDSAVTVASRRLQPGHCVSRLPADGDVSRVEVVPCDEPHEAAVVGSLEISGDEWPGKDRVERQAVDYCEMDSAEAEAGFRPVVWTPTRDGWGQGDRSALCLAWRETGPVTGSFTAGDEVAPS